MTWKEIKDKIEELGVTDDSEIIRIGLSFDIESEIVAVFDDFQGDSMVEIQN